MSKLNISRKDPLVGVVIFGKRPVYSCVQREDCESLFWTLCTSFECNMVLEVCCIVDQETYRYILSNVAQNKTRDYLGKMGKKNIGKDITCVDVDCKAKT